MKTPIEVAQIKAEALREAADDYVSEKTTIYREGDPKWHDSRINNWLRERADALVTPPVELPTEATLGWATDENAEPLLGVWRLRTDGTALSSLSQGITPDHVTAFTPAVAVPKAAIDELRDYFGRISALKVLTTSDLGKVLGFLAAVDEADR